uniref:Uncharacterized protein n=1 Tax=Arundo donax TaxID=35708 RepID=A0A0A9HKF1_ARUDO
MILSQSSCLSNISETSLKFLISQNSCSDQCSLALCYPTNIHPSCINIEVYHRYCRKTDTWKN